MVDKIEAEIREYGRKINEQFGRTIFTEEYIESRVSEMRKEMNEIKLFADKSREMDKERFELFKKRVELIKKRVQLFKEKLVKLFKI